MTGLKSPFQLDLRSIALFRIAFGCILFFDLFNRIGDAELFLSDDGVLSRADLLGVVDRPWSFSLYMMFGETEQVALVLFLHLVVSVLIIVGLWTRLATIASWVLLLSLLHRNPFILNGGDTLFSIYAFWLMFLPSNARWSIDSLLDKSEARNRFGSSDLYLGLPGVAIILQTVFVYVFTVIQKSGDLWSSGEVIDYVVRNQALIKAPAVWFLRFETSFEILTKLTFHWEWFGCVLALCPLFNNWTRSVAVVGYILMHAAFGLVLDIAIFAPVSIMSWLIFIPSSWWGGRLKWGGFVRDIRGRLESLVPKGGAIITPGWRSSWMVGVAISLVFVWNVRGLADSPIRKHVPKELANCMYLFKLRQNWSMFAPNPPKSSSWYALEAQLANGDSIDLFHPSEPFTRRRPEVFTQRVPDRRWTKYLSNLKKSKYRRLRNDYLEYFVKGWNGQVGRNKRIDRVSLLYFREPILPGSGYGKTEVRVLETVWADGVAQTASEVLQKPTENESYDSDSLSDENDAVVDDL
ncbi:HTTM domain-containing protein [Pelagicoccus mobilis]|uniref:HTTM domain-containing protein n=1 Tax=Pelagicoccus mobilis TaxID=415221 RepID=A0A934VQL4_9BACT|nr:HTTM domain-containing protein [Pelagicoccus mobilis]MBK1877025.1 HTTM domain-containing protein [Pelagicoccus mobilis]